MFYEVNRIIKTLKIHINPLQILPSYLLNIYVFILPNPSVFVNFFLKS